MIAGLKNRTLAACAVCVLGWVQPAAQPGWAASSVATGPLNTVRTEHTMTLLPSGKVLIVAGRKPGGGFFSSCELYDPATGKWSPTGSLSGEVEDQRTVLLLDGRVLIAGGFGPKGPRAVAECYDPSTELWTLTAPMSSARADHTATLLRDGRVLVAGGVGPNHHLGNPLDSAEIYDPASQTWTATGSLNFGRSSHKATLLPNGRVLVAGGAGTGAQPLASAELYDPTTGKWTMTGAMNVARVDHKPLLLPGGKVMVLGGFNRDDLLSDVELYHPAAGRWSATGSMIHRRVWNSVTLLPSGQVLVMGGRSECDGAPCVLDSAELYDPATERWRPAGRMNFPRVMDRVALLLNGKVLVAGGYNDAGRLLDCELFEPDAGPSPWLTRRTITPGDSLNPWPWSVDPDLPLVAAPPASPTSLATAVSPIILTDSILAPGGAFQFTFTNIPGMSFTVFGTTNLGEPLANWIARGGPVEILPGRYQFTDPHATNASQWFYCVHSP